ncbi:glycosyl hydrolase family 65 protein [Nocardia ignorata]|uniref:glycosyl hydrolase family 65 protein n=1 Tax=Nocardia ignorata TaxID=145285 RepID=UPI00362E1A81
MGLRCYSGIETRNDTLRLHPVLPAELGSGELTISYRGQPVTVTVTHSRSPYACTRAPQLPSASVSRTSNVPWDQARPATSRSTPIPRTRRRTDLPPAPAHCRQRGRTGHRGIARP